MLHIFRLDINKINSGKILEEYKKILTISMQNRAERYLSEVAKLNFIAGRMLLNKGLSAFGLSEQFEEIKYSSTQKPFVEGIHFNISHSSDLVVCAFSKNEFGIDIEKKRPIHLTDFKSFFTKKEWAEINSSQEPEDSFFQFWVRKESIIKCLGITLKSLNSINTSLDSDFIFLENKKLFLTKIDFGEGYFGSVCSDCLIEKIEIEDFAML